MSSSSKRESRSEALRHLADQVLEAPDLEGLVLLLTRRLPGALGVKEVTLLLWNRKLDAFEVLSQGETQRLGRRPAEAGVAAPEARYLISGGELVETASAKGEGTLLPLQARSGLVGMLLLGPRRGVRKIPYRPVEVRLLSVLASRCALALENHLYQTELIVSERMAALGTMAGMLAHDFRGPMTVIRGHAEMLQDPALPAEEVKEHGALIVEMIDRLQRMTTETLDFARGGNRLSRRPVEMAALLEELAESIEKELPGLEVVRRFRIPPEARAPLDVDKLVRAAGNLAANARDAMGGQGRLHLEARIEDAGQGDGGRRLVLVLSDEGPGIPEEIRERVFEPFVTRGKKGGTGLGLAVARRFIEDHGGTLELLPEGPGARFRIALPI